MSFLNILITSVLNSTSDRLAISSLLSCIFSGALICSFIWAIYFLFPYTYSVVRGGALGICQGRATHMAVLCCCMWGRSPRGNRAPCTSLCWFSVTYLAMHNQIGPFWSWFPGGWACVCSRTLGLSNELSSEAGSFSHCHLNLHKCFQWEVWGFIFLPWDPGLYRLSRAPVVPRSLSAHKCETTRSTSCHLTRPGPPASTLLQVLSTLPTGLDECFFNSVVVRLPYSSIFCQFWLFFVFKFVVLLLVVQRDTVYLPMPPSLPKVRTSFLIFLEYLSLYCTGNLY